MNRSADQIQQDVFAGRGGARRHRSGRCAGKSSVGAVASRNRRIIVSPPHRKLALVEDGRAIRVYAVAVGARVSPSPTGEFKWSSRLSDPTYYDAAS